MNAKKKSVKILIVGGGGREHALAWKLAQDARVEKILVAPGNAGCAAEPKVETLEVAADDISSLGKHALEQRVDLTVVGGETALVAGISDEFQRLGLRCFGPGKMGAMLEGSKSFCKSFLLENNIPTASWASFDQLEPALAHIDQQGAPLVIKADGLAAGKGVVIAEDQNQARDAAQAMLTQGRFGAAGQRIVIEEFLTGEEASFMAIVDGMSYVPLASSEDHKPLLDNDLGPNTGGMGACSPAPVIDAALERRIIDEVIEPTLAGLAARGIHYRGFLYAGLMISPDGAPKVLEYNCRLGDPETQPLMMRLKGGLLEALEAAFEGDLDEACLSWDQRIALGVTLATEGYPGTCRTGDAITLPEPFPPTDPYDNHSNRDEETKIFHAGAALQVGRLVTAGGRVLCATALGDTLADAHRKAYQLADKISWPGLQMRRDIGLRRRAS